MKKGIKRMHEQLMDEDEREIKRLKKKLKLKGDKTPRSMRDMGVDFILDHLDDGYDSETGKSAAKTSRVKEMKKALSKGRKAMVSKKSEEIESEDDDDEDDIEEDVEEEEEEEEEEEVEIDDDNNDDEEEDKGETDEGHQASVQFPEEKVADASRRIRRLLNRLDESQMVHVTRSVLDLFNVFPRALMKEALAKAVVERTCGGGGSSNALASLFGGAGTVLLSETSLLDVAACLAVVQAGSKQDVGPFVLEHLVRRFDEQIKCGEEDRDHVCLNALLVIAFCYKLGMINCEIVFDLLLELAEKGSSADLQCISRCLVAVGMLLRKDNALRMKELLERMYEIVKLPSNDSTDDEMYSRKELEEIIMGIKNNNTNKLPRYDPRQSDRYRKCMKGWCGAGAALDSRLPLRLDDLREGRAGRWWMVGSAFTPTSSAGVAEVEEEAEVKAAPVKDPRVEAAAQRLGLTSGLRREVFGVLVTSESAEDALVRLVSLGGSRPKFADSEVVAVLWRCLLAEKIFNPFYPEVLSRLCQHQRKFMIQVRFSIYDQVKKLANMKAKKREHLATAVGTLLVKECLPLSIFKNFDFSMAGADEFMRHVLIVLFSGFNTDQVRTAFSKLTVFPNLHKYLTYLLRSRKHSLPDNVKAKSAIAMSCFSVSNLM